VHVSTETIAVVISAAGVMLSIAAAFGWMIRRADAQFERMATDISSLRRETGDAIARVERELVEVKIAVARIEGPPRHLLSAR